MISTKATTQTWSNAPTAIPEARDRVNTLSPQDQEKYFQGQSLGDTLNKVADPNWVDESKKIRSVGNPELNKDAFMSLLLAQMKNQDPTSPLKSHEMAAQLAQFTSLEKLQGINDGVSSLRKDLSPGQNYQALSLIGKTVMVDNSKVSRSDAEERHDIRFNLASDALTLKAQIRDASGNVVRNLTMSNLKAGKNEIEWNGMSEDGKAAPIGEYTVAIEATSSNGAKVFAETKSEGTISGVNFTASGPQLLVGKQVLNMSDVKSVMDPQVTNSAPQPLRVPNQSPKKAEVKSENKTDDQKRAKLAAGTLNSANMDQGLINHLNKNGVKAGMSGS